MMEIEAQDIKEWSDTRIKQPQIDKYMNNGRDFIDDDHILSVLEQSERVDAKRIRDIIAKSLAIETLTLEETACLIRVNDKTLLQEMQRAALAIKKKVYVCASLSG